MENKTFLQDFFRSKNLNFDDVLFKNDASLKKSSIPVNHRPLRILMNIASEYKLNGFEVIGPLAEIVDWYEKVYNKKSNRYMCGNKMVVLISNEPYLAEFPIVYGTTQINLAKCVNDLTQTVLERLSSQELKELKEVLTKGYYNQQCICVLSREILFEAEIAATSIINPPHHYGSSKWASQMLVEKLIKRFISLKGGKIGYHHNLNAHIKQAEELGLANISPSLINKVSCSAEVRYKNIVTLEEAVAANQASLEICSLITNN